MFRSIKWALLLMGGTVLRTFWGEVGGHSESQHRARHEIVHDSLTMPGWKWQWWAVIYGDTSVETHSASICFSFNLSHRAHGEGGETLLKMNREWDFSSSFYYKSLCYQGNLSFGSSLLVSPVAAQLERGSVCVWAGLLLMWSLIWAVAYSGAFLGLVWFFCWKGR